MRLITLAFAVTLAYPAAAGQPSFDCLKATQPVERLICADGGLALMDRQMTEAYTKKRASLDAAGSAALVRDQREWVKRRAAACPVPSATDITSPMLWQASPCLARLYRDRLAALGVTAAPEPKRGPDFIHPFCIAETQNGPAPLAVCNAGNAHVPVSRREDWLNAEGTLGGPVPVGFSYRRVGTLPDGRLLVQSEFSWGASSSSRLDAVARENRPDGSTLLKAEVLHEGGGCFGGIDTVRLEGNKLEMTLRATPHALMTEAGVAPAAIEKLPDCHACCVGTLRATRPLGAGAAETILSATVPDDNASSQGSPAERCLTRAIHATAPTLPHTYDRAGLAALGKAFVACMAH